MSVQFLLCRRSGHNFDAGADVFVPFHSRLKQIPKAVVPSKQAIQATEHNVCSTAADDSAARASPTPLAASEGFLDASPAHNTDSDGGRSALESYGGVFDEAKRAVVFQRYCHVYQKGELRDLLTLIDGVHILEEYYDTGNHCILLEKL